MSENQEIKEKRTQSEVGMIVKVSGPLVVAKGMAGSKMFDMVRVSEQRLLGEIIGLAGDEAAIQVYEETAGIGPGEPVFPSHEPLSVELGPGLIESIYDGVQRPLDVVRSVAGDFISRGVEVPGLNRDRKWYFKPIVKAGDEVEPGDVIGEVEETTLIRHRIMVPPGVGGELVEIREGEWTINDTIAVLRTRDRTVNLTMMQRWPVRVPRPVKERLAPNMPLLTGQRVIDSFFPVAKGGTACVPGPFGSGKTVIQHQLAKWADAEVVIFVGCGERGNEMTDVLIEFPKLEDPRSPDRQHLQYAGSGAGGFGLHCGHDWRVFPGYGLCGSAAGRFNLPLGRGDARNLRPAGGDAGGRGLSGISGRKDCGIL